MQIDQEKYDAIAKEIHSESSPVGIDAEKTHVLILHMLKKIDSRLERVEAALKKNNPD